MKWTQEQLDHFAELRENSPFTGGRYIVKEKGWDFNLVEVYDRLHQPGFEQLTEDCKDYIAIPTSWKKSDDKMVIGQLNLELAVERNRIVCPRCKFPRAR